MMENNEIDYYSVLGVDKSCSAKTLSEAYENLVYTPEGQDITEELSARFDVINKAKLTHIQ